MTTSFTYDVNTGLPVVLDDGSRKYVWGIGLAYAVKTDGTLEVYQTDGLGSVRAITDSNGSITQTYRTDEFGIPTLTQGTSSQPFQYTGEQRDSESGLVYLRARMYDPGMGRFLQRDPLRGSITGPLSMNSYSYVANNPANLTDPAGLCVDPGGYGIRFCIDRFIPTATATAWPVTAAGDDRSTQANDPTGTFRIRQLISNNGLNGSYIGKSKILSGPGVGQSGSGHLGNCWTRVSGSEPGTGERTVAASCQGSIGVLPVAPPIMTEVFIRFRGNGDIVSLSVKGTIYPSLEIYQYGDLFSPRRLIYYDVTQTGTQPIDLIWGEVPLWP